MKVELEATKFRILYNTIAAGITSADYQILPKEFFVLNKNHEILATILALSDGKFQIDGKDFFVKQLLKKAEITPQRSD